MKFLKKLGLGLAALGAGLMLAPSASKAADFDASSTQGIISTALSGVTPTLVYGIGAILVIGLSIWAIFFVVGKLRKHVK